jgi:leucyl aminopeptidase (aminopeptidase T)
MILRLLAERAKTGGELARELGVPANRVHYHLKQLLSHELIEEVGKGRKRWKEERYFRARARHFVVDPRVGCGDSGTSASLTRSIDAAFLEWRRNELLKIDLADIAHRLVHECLGALPRERVLVMHGPQGFELAELVAFELEAFECRVNTRAWSHRTLMAILDRYDVEALTTFEFIPPEIDGGLDAVIFISSNVPGGPPPSGEQLAKLPLVVESISRWHRSMRRRRVRYVEFALPFRKEFEFGELSPEEAIDVFWRCVEVDRERLGRRARGLLALMGNNGRLHITGPNGTDLRIDVDLERAFVLDGLVSPDDVAAGHVFEGLPAGTLNFFPVKGSATGTFRADYAFLSGTHIAGPTVGLTEGRIARITADQNADVLTRRVDQAIGDGRLISGIRIGLNPAGRGPTGKPLLDACLAGTVTLHFGNNELQGGDVKSTLNLALPASDVSLASGDRAIIVSGTLPETLEDT